MIPHLLKTIVSWRRRLSRQKQTAGFTLIELLVVTIIAGLIVSSLLWLVVDLMRTNQREFARTDTQQQMKNALNYISEELRESVYVYTGAQLNNKIGDLPSFGADKTPILAFWKVEEVPYTESGSLPDCTTVPTAKQQECNSLQVERRAYTLVVYLQSTANPSNIWDGQSRIERYELRKYSDVANLTQSTGYVDPRSESTFQRWPQDTNGTDLQSGTPTTNASNPAVLVDFVDLSTNPNAPNCDADYQRTPTDATNTTNFFACVRPADSGLGNQNQDVVLFLRGNAEGKPGVSANSFLPVLETRVISRGVLDKQVPD